jgi:molecular chaperone DnaK (HSP70)
MRFGIDFGTTHTVVAYADRGNYPLRSFEDAAGDAHDFVPTLIAAGPDGELRFGWDAAAVAGAPAWTVLRSVKRLLGGPEASLDRQVTLGGRALSVRELVVGFLRHLRQRLGAEEGAPAFAAAPANAHGTQRFLTLEALRAAGFGVQGLVNEPSAAGFEYTHRHRATVTSRRDRVVVYDLGGGTFDASLVRVAGARHEVLATAGLGHLGGDDFDLALLRLVRQRFDRADALDDDALLERCRLAKEALGPNSRRVTVELDGGEPASLPVAEFYEACAPLIDRTVEAMLPVMGRLAADEQGEPQLADDVAGIYVVGGASTLPAVGRVLRERFGRRVHRSPYPFGAVAIGLAIFGDPDAGVALEDRVSRHFGVFREARAGAAAAFDPIVTADAALPPPGEQRVLARRYRASHNLGHYRFIECGALDDRGEPAGDITPSAEVVFPFDPALRDGGPERLREVPVRRTGAGPLVEERYVIDGSGLIEVHIADLDTGYAQHHRVLAG